MDGILGRGWIPLLAAAFLVVSPSFAKEGKGTDKDRKRPTKHLNHRYLVEELDLTKEQQKTLRDQRGVLLKRVAELKGEVTVQKAELRTEMEKPQPDRKKLERITKRISELRGMIANEKIQANLDAEKILTPEQRVKWRELQRAYRESERGSGEED